MADWKDPEVLVKCAALLANLSYVSSGAYTAEVIHTSVYDYEIVTRKRPWKWTMLVSTRYPSMLYRRAEGRIRIALLYCQMGRVLLHHSFARRPLHRLPS